MLHLLNDLICPLSIGYITVNSYETNKLPIQHGWVTLLLPAPGTSLVISPQSDQPGQHGCCSLNMPHRGVDQGCTHLLANNSICALNYCYTLSKNVYEEMYQSTHSVSYMNIVLQSMFSYIIIMQRGGTHCYSSTGANCLVGRGLV